MAGVPLNSTPGAGRGARRPRRAHGLRAAPRRRGPRVHPWPRLGGDAGYRRRPRGAALRPGQRAGRPRGERANAPPRHHRPRQPVPPRNTPEYRDLYAAFSRLGDSLAAAQKRTEQARQALDRARGDFLDRSESLRAAIRNWEDSTYRGYDSITRGLATRRRQDPRTDTTGGDGWARFELPPGAWWIYGRSWDATDPNAEWYWNVPVTGDTLLLSSRTGKQRRRY